MTLYSSPLLPRFTKAFYEIDRPLAIALICTMLLGVLLLYAAMSDGWGLVMLQLRNIAIAVTFAIVIIHIPFQRILAFAPLLYGIGILLLLGVEFFGETKKGAQRWLDLKVFALQPSELIKIALPLLLAWYFQKREGKIDFVTYTIAMVLLLIPIGLIAIQPDFGTAGLVFITGFSVIFFAGLSMRMIITMVGALLASIPLLWFFYMHDYQKQRILTLLNPESDPLGTGFHTIQGIIAVGSGGIFGKGYLQGTQSRLDFVPEATTDFIFSVLAEEWGLLGSIVLFMIFAFIFHRAMLIAQQSSFFAGRLLASSIALTFMAYVFINCGMVIGILPIVGVPLPLISYGGTSYLMHGIAFGIVLSISRYRKYETNDNFLVIAPSRLQR